MFVEWVNEQMPLPEKGVQNGLSQVAFRRYKMYGWILGRW